MNPIDFQGQVNVTMDKYVICKPCHQVHPVSSMVLKMILTLLTKLTWWWFLIWWYGGGF